VNLRDVQADTQHARYDFLIADSFATRAEAGLALGNPDAAQRVLERAEAAYATIRAASSLRWRTPMSERKSRPS
jgi:hypothetical protein